MQGRATIKTGVALELTTSTFLPSDYNPILPTYPPRGRHTTGRARCAARTELSGIHCGDERSAFYELHAQGTYGPELAVDQCTQSSVHKQNTGYSGE
jgi:hypothetical protein